VNTPEMTYRQLGDSSLEVSTIGLGTTHFGAFVDAEQSATIIGHAIDSGISLIDTAPVYGEGRSEEIVGDAIRTRRDEVVLATKMGLVIDRRKDGSFGTTEQPLTARNIRNSVEQSLRNLKTDRIELLQLYFFDDATPLDESLEELSRLQTEGKLLNIGCSNYSPDETLETNELASLLLIRRCWRGSQKVQVLNSGPCCRGANQFSTTTNLR
jgi:1-deoxyxylulose-5-phosphate synthase